MVLIYVSSDEKEYSALVKAANKLKLPITINHVHTGTQLFYYLNSISTSLELPDAVLVDSVPETESEKGVINEIKTTSWLSKIAVFVYSPFESEMDKRSCFDLGAGGFFVKEDSEGKRRDVLLRIYEQVCRQETTKRR
jgi:hypothetical protein